jgi:hypothetical protein
MRPITLAVAAVLLMPPVVPAYSQMGANKSISQPSPHPAEKKDEKTPEQKKADEKAYKDAIGRIPDQKFDPWRSVR